MARSPSRNCDAILEIALVIRWRRIVAIVAGGVVTFFSDETVLLVEQAHAAVAAGITLVEELHAEELQRDATDSDGLRLAVLLDLLGALVGEDHSGAFDQVTAEYRDTLRQCVLLRVYLGRLEFGLEGDQGLALELLLVLVVAVDERQLYVGRLDLRPFPRRGFETGSLQVGEVGVLIEDRVTLYLSSLY